MSTGDVFMNTAERGAHGTRDFSDTVALRVTDLAAVPAQRAPEPEEAAPAPARKSGRDRYLDLLRALALVRVVFYHTFNWTWLPIVFPSMGVMFALAGSLMVRSLKRPALSVIRGRLRRLLPPMWLFGAVVVPLMFLEGWRPDPHHPNWWYGDLLYWILPFSEPPFGATLHTFGGHLPSS